MNLLALTLALLIQGGHQPTDCHDIKFTGPYPELVCPEGQSPDPIALALCKVAYAELEESSETIYCLRGKLCTTTAVIARSDAWAAYYEGTITWPELELALAAANQAFHQCMVDRGEEYNDSAIENLEAFLACAANICQPDQVFGWSTFEEAAERDMMLDQHALLRADTAPTFTGGGFVASHLP